MRPKTTGVNRAPSKLPGDNRDATETAPPQPARFWLLLLGGSLLVATLAVGARAPAHSPKLRIDAGRQQQRLAQEIDALRRENRQLLLQAQALREDPATIEALARRDLGLIRPGEVVFVLTDVLPADGPKGP